MNGRTGWLRPAAMALVTLGVGAPAWALQDAPDRSPVNAPELASLGRWPIGVGDEELVRLRQADLTRGGVLADRRLPLTIRYPATVAGKGMSYPNALSGGDGTDEPFDLPGPATPGVAAAKGGFPLVILAHGYGDTPAVLGWLGENLASKGYVVVAPAFGGPPFDIGTAVEARLAR